MKKILFLMLCATIIIPVVIAQQEFRESHHYTFDNLLATIGNGTGLGDSILDDGEQGDDLFLGADGAATPFIIGDGFFFDGDVSGQSNGFQTTGYDAFTVTGWIDTIDFASGANYWQIPSSQGTQRLIEMIRSGATQYQFQLSQLSCGSKLIQHTLEAGFFHFALVANDTFMTFYVNNTNVTNVATGCAINTVLPNGVFDLGQAVGGAGTFMADDFRIFNYSLPEASLNRIWNNSFGTQVAIQDILNPNVTNVSIAPVVNILFPETQRLYNNNPLDINYTIELDTGATVTQIEISINGTLNKTIFTNTNTSIDIGDGLFNVTVDVTDSNALVGSDNVVNWKVDRTNPFDNLLTVLPGGTNITKSQNTTVTAFNTNLFGHNVTLFNSLDAILFSQEVLNISQPTNNIILQIDLATIGAGTFRVISNESDDHTKNRIKNYKQKLLGHKIEYDTGTSKVSVEMKAARKKGIDKKHKLTNLKSIKKQDRYEFGFITAEVGNLDYEFDIISDHKIYFRENSDYNGHFVTQDNWIDFMPYTPTVIQMSDTWFKVFLTAPSDVTFQSIGGVNFASSETTFNVPTPTVSLIGCDFGAGSTTCEATDTDILDKVITTCTDSETNTVVIVNETNSLLLASGSGINVTNIFTFDNTNITLQQDDIIRINSTCSNEAVGTEGTVLFTVSALPEVEEQAVGSGIIAVASAVVTFLVLLIIVLSLIMERRKKK